MDRKSTIREIKKIIDNVLDLKKSASLGAVEIYKILEEEMEKQTNEITHLIGHIENLKKEGD